MSWLSHVPFPCFLDTNDKESRGQDEVLRPGMDGTVSHLLALHQLDLAVHFSPEGRGWCRGGPGPHLSTAGNSLKRAEKSQRWVAVQLVLDKAGKPSPPMRDLQLRHPDKVFWSEQMVHASLLNQETVCGGKRPLRWSQHNAWLGR